MTKITVPVPKLDEAIAKVLSSGSRGVEPRIAIRRDLCRTDNSGVPRFEPGQLPPANAFWSVTMYDEPNKLLVPNPIDRYLINSPMLPQLTKDKDGGLTLYLQSNSQDKESNWLPAPKVESGASPVFAPPWCAGLGTNHGDLRVLEDH